MLAVLRLFDARDAAFVGGLGCLYCGVRMLSESAALIVVGVVLLGAWFGPLWMAAPGNAQDEQ